jgi:hypothetical protein
MENGPKLAIGVTVALVLAVGVRVGLIYKANHEAGPAKAATPEVKVNPDYLVFRKKLHPDSLADQRDLIGKTVWMAAGGEMDYYVDKGKHVDYAKPVGAVLDVEPMIIKEVFEEKAPSSGRAVMRVAPGEKQVLLGFTLPHSADPKTLYALPVGYYDQSGYTFYDDDMFFYDDPHQLYNFWPAQMWQHIDNHEPALGMNEDQMAMALGQVASPSSDSVGDRTMTYDNGGKPIVVEFENNKAVKITPQ